MMNAQTICLTIGLIIVAGTAWGQVEVEWERTYGGGAFDGCFSMIQTNSGGFALGGYTSSFGSGGDDFWILCSNENGDSLWANSFGTGTDEWCNSMLQKENGEIILGGQGQKTGEDALDMLLMGISESGDSLWSRYYGAEGYDRCLSHIQTSDGGFALSGQTISLGAETSDFLLLKADDNGDSLWAKTYGGESDELCFSIIESSNNCLLLGGWTDSFGEDNKDAWIICVNAEGDSLWSQTLGGAGTDVCSSVKECTDGGFVCAGWTSLPHENGTDYWLARLAGDGELMWMKTYEGGDGDICTEVMEASGSGFVLAGLTHLPNQNNDDCFMVRTDENGELLWSAVLGNELDNWCFEAVHTRDGGYAMGGWCGDVINWNMDFYLVKTTPDPNSVRDPGSTLNPLTFNLYPAFPNPFNSTVTIPFGLDKSAPTRLAIFDPLGRRVAELIPNGYPPFNSPPASMGGKYSVIWDAKGMPAGQYIVKLQSGQSQATSKISVIK